MAYRAKLRGFELQVLEDIIRYSSERYFDTATRRNVVVGKHDTMLVLMPFEVNENCLVPVTVHSTSRQQIRFRLKTGRFIRE